MEELQRFRQLVVNSVMATDVMDKELKGFRDARWVKAFAPPEKFLTEQDQKDNFNRKATIVIEHLIQASDVAHTMQVRKNIFSCRPCRTALNKSS